MKTELKWGLFAIGVVFMVMGGYYFHAVQGDFDRQCSGCVDQYCMDNDIICGDFGQYHFKFFILLGLIIFGIFLTIINGGIKDV